MPNMSLRNISEMKKGIIIFIVSIILMSISFIYIQSFLTRSKENIIFEWKGKIEIDSIISINGKWKTNWCEMDIITPVYAVGHSG